MNENEKFHYSQSMTRLIHEVTEQVNDNLSDSQITDLYHVWGLLSFYCDLNPSQFFLEHELDQLFEKMLTLKRRTPFKDRYEMTGSKYTYLATNSSLHYKLR